MARIARVNKDHRYVAALHASIARGEKNDCSVVAFSIVADVSYDEAHKAMKRQGRRDHAGMYYCEAGMVRELRALGLNVSRIDPEDFIRQYPGNHKSLKSVTTHHPARFKKVWSDGATYLFFTADHVAAVVDGNCCDWSIDRALRVTEIYKIS